MKASRPTPAEFLMRVADPCIYFVYVSATLSTVKEGLLSSPSFYFRILSSVFPRIFSFALSLISRFFILAISDLMCSGFE